MTEKRDRLTIDRVELRAAKAEGGPRRFSMVAHTGPVMDRWWGRFAIDLAGIEVPERLPMLLNHNADEVTGVADGSKVTKEGLVLEGNLSSKTAAGRLVADLADEKFPWTASIGVEGLVIEELAEGVDGEVNGQKLKGPASIWRKSRLFETSFVTAGPADHKTSAQVLREEEKPMKPEEFLKANPQAVEAWKQEAAKAANEATLAKLAAFTKAFPERLSFALEQLLAGKSLVEAQAAEGELLRAENKKLLEERAQLTKPEEKTDVEKLAETAKRSTVGFDGASRQGGSEELAGLPAEERAKREYERSPEIRQAFTGERSYAAYLRAEARGIVRPSMVERASEALRERSGK